MINVFFLCQFGFMEPIKQTVENNIDSVAFQNYPGEKADDVTVR